MRTLPQAVRKLDQDEPSISHHIQDTRSSQNLNPDLDTLPPSRGEPSGNRGTDSLMINVPSEKLFQSLQPRARPGQRKPPIQQAHKGAAYLQGVDDSVQKRLRKVRPKDQSSLVLRKPPQVPPINGKQYQSAATIASEDYSNSAQADGEEGDSRR